MGGRVERESAFGDGVTIEIAQQGNLGRMVQELAIDVEHEGEQRLLAERPFRRSAGAEQSILAQRPHTRPPSPVVAFDHDQGSIRGRRRVGVRGGERAVGKVVARAAAEDIRAAYRDKYRRYPGVVPSIVSPEGRVATLQHVPRHNELRDDT